MLIIPKKENSVVGSLSGTTTQYLEDTSWSDEINEFVELIIEDKPVEKGNSHDALKVMILIEQIYNADDSWNEQTGIN